MEIHRCRECGRRLTSARSIGHGYGPTCRAKILAAAKTADLGPFKPFQIAKAVEIIEQGGILPTRRRHLFLTVSSDGASTYLTASQACTCPAGIKGRRCYHRAAVDIILTARRTRRRYHLAA